MLKLILEFLMRKPLMKKNLFLISISIVIVILILVYLFVFSLKNRVTTQPSPTVSPSPNINENLQSSLLVEITEDNMKEEIFKESIGLPIPEIYRKRVQVLKLDPSKFSIFSDYLIIFPSPLSPFETLNVAIKTKGNVLGKIMKIEGVIEQDNEKKESFEFLRRSTKREENFLMQYWLGIKEASLEKPLPTGMFSLRIFAINEAGEVLEELETKILIKDPSEIF